MKGPGKGIVPFLWFDTQAEEAAHYYASIIPGAKFGEIQRFPAGARGAEGSVMTASFELGGQTIVALNGNKRHAFSPASSLLFFCKDGAEAESWPSARARPVPVGAYAVAVAFVRARARSMYGAAAGVLQPVSPWSTAKAARVK